MTDLVIQNFLSKLRDTLQPIGEFLIVDVDDLVAQSDLNTYSNFTILFNNLPNYRYYTIAKAVIPKSYNMVESGYNTFIVSGNTVTIPAGNYSYIQMISALSTALNALAIGTFTVTFSTITRLFTITSTAPFSFTFSSNSDINRRLGFSIGVHNSSLNTLISDQVINLNLTSLVAISSDLSTARLQNSINQRIVDIIPDNIPTSSLITYICPDLVQYRKEISNSQRNSFNIQLFDDNNRLLNMNEQAATLMIWFSN